MNIDKQISIVKELLEGVDELNGEFQEGWDDVIKDGKKLLKYLNNSK